ncbi:MAG: hypothetical protein ABUL49_01920, partial [bacterium]
TTAPAFVQGGVLLGTVSIAVSQIRAYVGRVEPVVEALSNLKVASLRLAAVFAVLCLIAAPSCMAWDRALTYGMAQFSEGRVR